MMKRIPLNFGTMVTGIACLGAAGLVAISLPTCASQPTPRCAVPPGSVIASYIAAGPPTVAPGAPSGTDCSTFVPPYLQASCAGGCAPVTTTGAEVFNLETGYPDPNDPNWVHTPYSMSIFNAYVSSRIQDYINNVLPFANVLGPVDGGYPNYPYTGDPPPNPPADPTETNRPYSWGAFDSVYPSNGICTVKLAPSTMTYPDIPAHPISGSSPSCIQSSDCMDGGTAPCVCQDGTMPPCMDDAGTPTGLCSDTPINRRRRSRTSGRT